MRLLKRILIIFVIYLLIRNFHLLFIYKDALFFSGGKKELTGKIVYDSTELKGNIVIIELPSGKKTVIPDEISVGWAPSFSPDGKRFVFQGRKDILYTINVDGTGLKKFFDFRRLAEYASWDITPGAYVPSCSPDGERVAFISEKGLYITDVNNPYAYRRILDIRLAKCQPAWSPDGRRIAVVSDERIREPIKPGWYSEIFAGRILIVNTDGTGLRVLTGGTDPSWSPDGKKIAYKAEGGYYIIDVDDSNGSSKEFIFSTDSIIKSGVSVPPRWSPDGRYIIVGKKLWFYTDGIYAIPIDNPKRKIWIDADGTNMKGMSWVK